MSIHPATMVAISEVVHWRVVDRPSTSCLDRRAHVHVHIIVIVGCDKLQRSQKDHCGGCEKCSTSPHLASDCIKGEEAVRDRKLRAGEEALRAGYERERMLKLKNCSTGRIAW